MCIASDEPDEWAIVARQPASTIQKRYVPLVFRFGTWYKIHFECIQDSPLAADLVKILQQANQEVPHFLAQAIKPNTAVTHQQPFHNGNAF